MSRFDEVWLLADAHAGAWEEMSASGGGDREIRENFKISRERLETELRRLCEIEEASTRLIDPYPGLDEDLEWWEEHPDRLPHMFSVVAKDFVALGKLIRRTPQ